VLAATAGRATEQVANAEIFVFFLLDSFKERTKSKTERKETGLRNLFSGCVGWQAPSPSFNVNSF
jgi:hypothetical protein